LKQEIKSNYEYVRTVTEIRNYRELVFQLPKSIKFPLFAVNIISIKNELLGRVDELVNIVFEHLENDIIRKSEAIKGRHQDIGKLDCNNSYS
jgi:hypothetical protein